MPTFYSDQYTATGAGQTSLPASPVKPGASMSGGALMYKRCQMSDPSDAAAAADVIRFCTLPSGARIVEMVLTTLSVWTGGTLDIGLHKAGSNHDGAVIDADLFASALDINGGALDRTATAFTESATVTTETRGKPLWFYADAGAGTYTADPGEEWEITGTLGGTPAGAGVLVLEIYYTID